MRDTSTKKASTRVHCEPNAPLLIRIVRDPYQEDVTYARRIELFEPISRVRARLELTEPLMQVAGRERNLEYLGNPFRKCPLGPIPRPRVSVEAWISSKGAR